MDTPLLILDTYRTDPINQCVYCGSKDDLTDEHVVPFALGGRYILSKSSCTKCAAITSKIERSVLRGFMLEARTVGNFPTRNEKSRPKTLPLEIKKNGVFTSIELLPQDHPGILTLPIFKSAGFRDNVNEVEGLVIAGNESIGFGKDINEIGKSLNAEEIRLTQDLDVWSYARMLSKIAYCSAVASLGILPIEKVPIIPFILKQSDDGSKWFGSGVFRLNVEEQKPNFALGTVMTVVPGYSNPVIVIQLKLFADVGATGYEVFICEVDDILLNKIATKNL